MNIFDLRAFVYENLSSYIFDSRLYELMKGRYLLDTSNQIVFEMIRDYYLKSENRPKSTISKHCNGVENDEVIKRYSRQLVRTDYYQDMLNEQLKKFTGADIPELQHPSMKNRADHFKGRFFTDYHFMNLDFMNDIPLLKMIESRRITDVKKVSNGNLADSFDEYYNYLIRTKPSEDDDYHYVLWVFNFFAIESFYQISSVYKLATVISEYNYGRSKKKFSDDDLSSMLMLLMHYVVDGAFPAFNSMLLGRMEAISELNPDNVEKIVFRYRQLLESKAVMKIELEPDEKVKEILSLITLSDIKLFIKENYNIEPLLSEKFKWEHKKEFYIRHFFNKMVMTSNPPPMK